MISAGQQLAGSTTKIGSSIPPRPRRAWSPPLRSPGPSTMRVGFTTVDGLRIRHAESEGPSERTILLTSPWPETLYAFAPIWRALARRFRLFAIDLPGLGASDSRAELQYPRAMGSFLLRVIDECQLGRPHLVAPDIGTIPALFAAADSCDALASVVVGCAGATIATDLRTQATRHLAMTGTETGSSSDFGENVSAALDAAWARVSRDVREDYLACYSGDRFLESARYFSRHRDELPMLIKRLRSMTTPVLVFSGADDRAVRLEYPDLVAANLPRSAQATIGAGHFVWEEAPDAFASMVSQWVSRDHREVGLGTA